MFGAILVIAVFIAHCSYNALIWNGKRAKSALSVCVFLVCIDSVFFNFTHKIRWEPNQTSVLQIGLALFSDFPHFGTFERYISALN